MNDYLIKSITEDGMFRAYALTAKKVVETAHKDHNTWSTSSVALGRTLIGAVMLATATDKDGQAISVKINGGGPTGTIVADADSNGNVKGYISNAHVRLQLNKQHKIDVGQAVGKVGGLEVTKILEKGEPYTSSVPLASGEIGDDFTFYLAQSEQIPSAVGVSVVVNEDYSIKAAGGYLIQALPGASDGAIGELEKRLQKMPSLSEQLISGNIPEKILKGIFPEKSLNFLTTMPIQYVCDCSKAKFATDIQGLPMDQLQSMLKEDHGLEVTCKFCGKQYEFDEADLQQIITKAERKKAAD